MEVSRFAMATNTGFSRAVTISSPENRIELIDRPIPQPRRGEVVIRMLAASLNFRDVEIVRGTFQTAYRRPLIPLSDGVGEVVAVGEDITRVKLGDRVAPTFWRDWIAGDSAAAIVGTTLGGPLDGVLAEHVSLEEQRVVQAPAHLTDVEAATLTCAGVTAWHSLITVGALAPGETVLIQGTGGVAMFALQFAALLGATPIVISGSDVKLERARALGAAATVNYVQTPEWDRKVRDLTDDRGVDHILELGGPSTFSRSLNAARVGGQIYIIGYLGGKAGEINPLEIFRRRLRAHGVSVGSRDSFEAMNRAIASARLRPIIDSVFPWTEAPTAIERLESGTHIGKVALKF